MGGTFQSITRLSSNELESPGVDFFKEMFDGISRHIDLQSS